MLIVLPRGGVGVLVAQIDLACGHTVADHLADVPQRDLHTGEAGFRGAVVLSLIHIFIGIENNKPECIDLLCQKTKDKPAIEVKPLPSVYGCLLYTSISALPPRLW